MQLARNLGAEVVAVDTGPKLEMVSELGATRVIDYTSEKFTLSGEKFDVILDVVGSAPLGPTMRLLNPGGRLFLANPRLHSLLRGALWSLFTSRKVQVGAASEEAADLAHLLSLVSSGDLEVVLDRTFTLDEVAVAHRYAESGSKIGNIVVAVA